jgi:hypothetical protein
VTDTTNLFADEDWYDENMLADRSREVTREILKLLRDGEWHKREDVVRAVLHRVPPGKAIRFWQRARLNSRTANARKVLSEQEFKDWLASAPEAQQDWENPHRPISENDKIFHGARAYVTDALTASKRIERKTDENGVKWVRRVPMNPSYVKSDANQLRMELMRRGAEGARRQENG